MTPRDRVVTIIPARYGSRRLPAKPLVDICGKPMIQHVYERASQARSVDWCLVATDDERIAARVREFGGHAVLTPDTLETGTDRVAFVARSIPDATIIVNVQGDEPLLEPEMINEAVRAMASDMNAVAVTLIHRISSEDELTNPATVKVVIDSRNNCLYFSRSPVPFARDVPVGAWSTRHHYYKHVGLYVYRRDFLLKLSEMNRTPLEITENLEQLRILEHGYSIKASLTDYDSAPVDTEEDLMRVRTILSRGQ
jgi:3-deoxy-manno-octulosonate cytidylyltransferase (CMP-KDO synthetase)